MSRQIPYPNESDYMDVKVSCCTFGCTNVIMVRIKAPLNALLSKPYVVCTECLKRQENESTKARA